MKLSKIILIIMCFSAPVQADAQNDLSQKKSINSLESRDIFDHWRRSTIAIGLPIEGKFITIGSGLMVSGDGGKSACIVTAKHVFVDLEKGWTPSSVNIRLPKESISSDEDFGEKLELVGPDGALWRSAQESDIAIIHAPDLRRFWNIHAVSIDDFGSADDVYQGAPVLTLGYPMIPGQEYLITPIARGGIIAWVDPIAPLDKPFLIDSSIVHGNSGGPVFHIKNGLAKDGSYMLGGGFAFIGIVSKNATEEAPVHVGTEPALRLNQSTGKVERYEASVENIGAIGIIEPVSKVRALVQEYCSN